MNFNLYGVHLNHHSDDIWMVETRVLRDAAYLPHRVRSKVLIPGTYMTTVDVLPLNPL